MPQSRLLLKNMEFYGYHGVFAAERELGQKIVVDVELESDFCAAGKHDDFTQTINYAEVYRMVKEVVEEAHFSLIEAIAAAILERIKKTYVVAGVTVRVRKPQPPVGGLMESAEYELTDRSNA